MVCLPRMETQQIVILFWSLLNIPFDFISSIFNANSYYDDIRQLLGMSYEQTRNEIERTFGSVPGFMNGMPNDVLVQMWPIMKTYTFGQTKNSCKI